MFAQITAPCTCPVCGSVRRTEPVLPKLPSPAPANAIDSAPLGRQRTDECNRIYRHGRWFSIY